ncbi:MAG TPA: hypothetical protein VKF41_06605 [Bryobacteraceae bacterium]|nr:hypothetical protein [Bryobacteraceae bacterium]
MTRDDIRKLLGGYSTGTLTPEEQRALFAAALEDQGLFDALAGEQALRDLLRDPAARAHLLASLDERPEPWWRRLLRPAAVGAIAAGCLAAVVGYGVWHARRTQPPVLVAANREARVAPPQSASPAAEPAGAVSGAERLPHRTAPLVARLKSEPSSPPQASAAAADLAVPNGSVSARIRQPAPPELETSPAVPAAPATRRFDEGVTGAAGKANEPAANGPAFAPVPSYPAPPPPPRDFAAAPPAPKPAQAADAGAKQVAAGGAALARAAGRPAPVPPPSRQAALKKEENGAANQVVLKDSEFAQQPVQNAAMQSAPAPAGFTQDRKDAAAEANQLAAKGSVGQLALDQAQLSQADQLRTQGGAPAQSVEVTADASVQEVQSMNNQQVDGLPAVQRQTRQMAPKAATPEVKWSALRRARDTRLLPVAPDRIRAGDSIVLRLEPSADGTLSVSQAVPGSASPRILIAGTSVKRAQLVDTPAVTLDHPGVLELLVRFTAQTAAPPLTIALRFR